MIRHQLQETDAGASCAIYARYSSDAQRESSIDDQIRICRQFAEKRGWQVTQVFADHAISGATDHRPGYQAMIAAARVGQFQHILAESIDRLSRDQEHIARLYKQSLFGQVGITTILDGEVCELKVALKGMTSALYLKELAARTHRGLEGRVVSGHSAGGLSYGYKVRRGMRADGSPVTGELEIVKEQAEVIRRIFADYARSLSPRAIARALNAEGVAGPRNGQWTASLLLGSAARETGLLRNRLYVGERVWNRQDYLKDPDTGKRRARMNPKSAWITDKVPLLAIVERQVWDQVQSQLSARSISTGPALPSENLGTRLSTARRPRWALAGLGRCGLCDGPMSVMGSQGRLGCANHVERGTCENRRTVLRDALLSRVLHGLKEHLLAPELVAEFVRAHIAETNAANRNRKTLESSLEQQKSKLDRQIRNLLDLLKEGHGGSAMAGELREVENQKAQIEADIAATAQPEPVPVLHPSLPDLYRRQVEALEESLRNSEMATDAISSLQSLIGAVRITPREGRGEYGVTLVGDLAAFMVAGDAGVAVGRRAKSMNSGGKIGLLSALDAGTGFEPVTFRL
ncbi:MAG: recombinase family protein [Pseudanabaena sp.]